MSDSTYKKVKEYLVQKGYHAVPDETYDHIDEWLEWYQNDVEKFHQQLTYYADKGWGSSEVTGAQMTLTLTGSVKPGDDACDYILGDDVMYGLGEKRKTHLKLQKGKKVIIWPITLEHKTLKELISASGRIWLLVEICLMEDSMQLRMMIVFRDGKERLQVKN